MAKKVSLGRRNFLKVTTAGAAGIALASKVDTIFAGQKAITANSPLNKWPGKVVINFNKNGPSTNVAPTTAQITIIKIMVDDSIKLLSGQTTVAAAWKALFPSTLTATSKIAIKIPILNAAIPCPHWSSVQAIVEGLTQMDIGGTKFPASNITIYDNNNGNTLASAGYTATAFPGVTLIKDSTSAYTDGATNVSGAVQPYSKTLNAAAFLINVFSPRGHSTYAGNFTLGFKNHYGTYPTAYHDTNTSPYLRNLNCTGPVYNKTVISICSGIYGMNESHGPSGSADNYSTYSKSMDSTSTNITPTTIIMSTDPISCEMQAIKMMRINNKGKYTTADMPDYLKASAGVTVSGWTPINNIGTIDETKMNILKIINGVSTTPVVNPNTDKAIVSGAAVIAHQISGHKTTFIEFKLPVDHVGKEASIEIFDINGALIRKFSHAILGIMNHFSWDETNSRGDAVAKGIYIVRLVSGAQNASSNFSIAR